METNSETSKTVNVEKREVVAIVTVRASRSDPERTFTWVLDYSKCDDAQLLEKASRSDIITLQARWRAKPFDQTHFNVAEDLKERPRLTEAAKAKRELERALKGGLSKEQLLKMLEDLE